MMRDELATYGEAQHLWDHRDAEGFSKIWGIPSKIYGLVNPHKWL
jgi:argininosuccinate synthase